LDLTQEVQQVKNKRLYKNTLTYKPDSVFLQAGISIIYLALTSLSRSICLPLPTLEYKNWASNSASEEIEMYMAFQPTRFIHQYGYPNWSCALTARFHLYPCNKAREV